MMYLIHTPPYLYLHTYIYIHTCIHTYIQTFFKFFFLHTYITYRVLASKCSHMARILHSGVIDVFTTTKIFNSNSSGINSAAAEYVCIAEENTGSQGDLLTYIQRHNKMVIFLIFF